MEHFHLEDLYAGQRFRSRTYVIEEAKIKEFAAEFDPPPFHLDMRLLVTGGLPPANGIIGLCAEIAWPRAERPGDSLYVDSEILDIAPSRSKPNQALVSVSGTMLNQKNEPRLNAKWLVFKRP